MEIAFIRSDRLVNSTMNACRAGMSNAIATPFKAANIKMCSGRILPLHTSAASVKASIIIVLCAMSTTRRFG